MMSIEHSGAVTLTTEPALAERLHRLAEGSTDYNEVAAVNLLATGISLLIAARGHHTTIEMLERAIAVVEDDRADHLGKAHPIADKPITVPAKTGGTLKILGMRGRGPLRG
jgi:hypothetical protein